VALIVMDFYTKEDHVLCLFFHLGEKKNALNFLVRPKRQYIKELVD
jgi:hypothetical protein